MIDLVQDFFLWVASLPPVLAYGIILAVAYGENLVPPMPGDVLIVFAGYLVATGSLDPWLVVALATIGGTAGFMTMVALGRRIEGAIRSPDRFRWIPKQRIKRAIRWVNRYGFGVVLANRFLSGLRSVISIATGMARLNVGRTTLYAAVSALVWSSLMVLLGYWVGKNWEVVATILRRYSAVVTVIIVLIVAVQIIRYRRDRDPEPDPPQEPFTEH